ncbi:DUF2787 family protein [Vibrio gangliei]|uniref:DUF2787 family protein n=1 Tax=Vibrio gangliei TaxID=2077090 RepID=UPI000D013C16|nr:DUF2787 family protein [Vibrio gangliei]
MKALSIQSELLPISDALVTALNNVVTCVQPSSDFESELLQAKSITFNFRDESYSAENGGFHPVEIQLQRASIKSSSWQLAYITTFAYIGNVYPELERNLDFDCQSGRCLVHPHIQWEPIKGNQEVLNMYQLWESSFLSYLEMGSYCTHQVTVNDNAYCANPKERL